MKEKGVRQSNKIENRFKMRILYKENKNNVYHVS